MAEVLDVFFLCEAEPSHVNNDAQLFFEHGFSELAGNRWGVEWLTTGGYLYLHC